VKNKKFHVSQFRNRILTCWITKGWRKDYLDQVLSQPFG